MKKCLARDDSMYNVPSYIPQYNPNKEVVMENLGRVRDFTKMSRRESLFVTKIVPDPYDVSFEMVYPKKRVSDFARTPPRFREDDSPLPSFMQTVHSRNALEFTSMKTLEVNYFDYKSKANTNQTKRKALTKRIFMTQSNPNFSTAQVNS